MNKKHILITNATIFEDIIGGAQKATDEIANSLSDLGYDVTILVPDRLNKGKRHYQSESKKYQISKYKSFKGIFKFFNIFSSILKFNEIHNIKKIDILWGNSPEPWLFLPLRKVPKVIYTMHGPWLLERKLDNRTIILAKILCPLLVRQNVLYHFQSQYVYDICCQEIRKLDNVEHIIAPLLIDECKIKNELKIADFNYNEILLEKKLNVLLPRRLVNRTGVIEFLDITSGVEFNFLNIIVVGSGYLEKKVYEISLNHPNMIFLGKIKQNKLDMLFSKSDLVCMPSIDAEGFGVSILEAIFRNTPVVYTGGGGMGEFLSKIPECKTIILNDKNNILSVFNECLKLKKINKLIINKRKIPYNFIENLKVVING
jgi:glycosyltransferase involved in cell wall biosynthesis